MFRFATPFYFLLLIPLGYLAWRRFTGMGPPEMTVSAAPMGRIRPSAALVMARINGFFPYLALALMVAALARPQWGDARTVVRTEGVNIVLALDLSESMAALDFKQKGGKLGTRLDAVKYVVSDFIRGREGDRIAMVVFGSQAYTQSPLTRDYPVLVDFLNRLEIGAAGPKTAMGDAIGISLKRLLDIKSKSNVIVLLTDGRSNSGELTPEAAATVAKKQGVKIYTIGAGSRGPAPFMVKDALGRPRYVRQSADIDEATLKKVADMTGGLYFRAENTDGLREIYATIDKMEKTQKDVRSFTDYNDLYPWLLSPALALAGIWLTLISTRFLKIP